MEEKDIALSGIVVGIDLSKDYMIPKDSYAFIDKGLLGDPSIKLVMGKSSQYVVDGDSLLVQPTTDLVGDLKKTLSPALDNLNATMTSVQTTLQKFNEILNPATQENIRSMIAHLNETTAALEILMDPKNGKLANSLTHIEHITGNLDKNSGKIDTTLTHLQTFSENLSQADITALVKDLKNTLAALDKTIVQVNDPKGSVGALLHERSLHNELQQTSRSLTILLDDLKTHPKRYINISVFGKKDKSTPLSKPLYDSTLK
jgi:phospholipid/cholesterol/gamma-HCH transport system substrate-binding protein